MNKNPLPKQLHNPSFKFYIAGRNKKIPIERRWNSDNNYMFFDSKLLEYINNGYNIGICGGFGRLIVIDFDDKEYQEQKEKELPRTFTVRTAGKGLKHKYYLLKGDMISKVGVDTKKARECSNCGGFGYLENKEQKCLMCEERGFIIEAFKTRVADIQAGKSGVICPPSKIDRKCYSVIDETPIAEITLEKLSKVFGINSFKHPRKRDFKDEYHPEKIQKAIDLFKLLGIERTNKRHFKCPFHQSINKQSLHIFDDGGIFCFSCQRHFRSYEHFTLEYYKIFGIKNGKS